MANALDQFMDAAREVANKAVDAAGNLAAKGKDKLDRMSLENELAKAQRQLGALVYSLRKSGEENPDLVEHYIEVIADVEAKLNEHEAAQAERLLRFDLPRMRRGGRGGCRVLRSLRG